MRPATACFASLFVAAATASAQQQAWRLEGGQRSELFGHALVTLDDRNGDGIRELLVGAPSESFWEANGHVRVLSGADLSLLLDVDGGGGSPPFGDAFGYAVAALADVDGDGVQDFLVGVPDRQRVSLRSGADGHELQFYGMALGDFGRSLAVLGDLDSDGVPDFAAGSPSLAGSNGNHGVVRVLSAATGTALFRFEATIDGFRVGGRDWIAAPGDLDGDGLGDLALVDEEIVGSDLVHVVRALSGATGLEIGAIRFDSADLVDDNVMSLAAAGDIDGDGVGDLLIGTVADAASGPAMGYLFSGATGAELRRFTGGDASTVWVTLRATGDHDGDGVGDFVLACDSGNTPTAPNPGLHLLSGADGSLLDEIATTQLLSWFGNALVADLDVDGDGVDDVLFGDPTRVDADFMTQGAVEAWSWSGSAPLAVRLGDSSWNPVDATARLIGDVDGDGAHDVATIHNSFSANVTVELRSGRDGALFAVHPSGLPLSLAPLPDLDGDGLDDYAAGFPSHVELRSGPTGAVIGSLPGPLTSFEFGRNVVAGIEPGGAVRVAVADPNSATAKFEAGEIHLFDAATGALLLVVLGNSNREHLGTSLVPLGDVTGDGVGDWAAGAPENAGGGTDAGRVVFFNGATGVVFKVLRGTTGDRFGATLAVVSDLDGDLKQDLAIGAPDAAAQAGRVTIVSTANWATLATFTGAGAGERFGARLAALGDVNRDGFIDWATLVAGVARVEARDGRIGALLAKFELDVHLPAKIHELRSSPPWAPRSASGDKIPDLLVLDDGVTGFGGATLFALDDLLLQLEPPAAAAGAAVVAATRGGPPFNPVALELVAFAGTHVGLVLQITSLDAVGAWSVGDTVPPGLAGLTADFRSWAVGANGKLMKSPVQTLRFE